MRRTAEGFDRVGVFGALVVLAGSVFLPFVEFRANRIVSGVPEPLTVAGFVGWLLPSLAVLAIVAARFPRPWRGRALLSAGAALVAVVPWALGAAASRLLAEADAIARVSVGAGAWLVVLGGAVVWYAGAVGGVGRATHVAVAVVVLGSWIAGGVAGGLAALSFAREYTAVSARFWRLVREHLALTGLGLGSGVALGVPLGVLASRNRIVRDVTLGIVGVIQTVPSLALLGLLVFPLAALGLPGIGTLPATIALGLYALLPVVRNTYVGLAGIDPAAIDAGRGMGMSQTQLLLRVEAPLALPLILEGVRAAAVLVIGIAAVTAFVGAGGLGILVFQGWGQQADDLTLLGALPMVALAIAADVSLRALAALLVSPGLKEGAL